MLKALGRILRFLLIVAVIAAVAAGGFLFWQSQGSTAAQDAADDILDETVIERGDLRVTIGTTNTLAPNRQVQLRFELTTLVEEIYVQEGQTVAAGDPIARVNADDLQAALNDAQILLDIRRISLEALLTPPRPEDIAAAQAALDSARAQLAAAYATGSPQTAEIARIQAELARNALWQAQLQRDQAVNPPTVVVSQTLPDGSVVTQEVDPPGANPEAFEPGLTQAEFGVQIADANAVAAADNNADPGSIASAEASIVAAQTTLDRLVNGADEMDIAMAEIELAQAQESLDSAQATLARATLTAPFAGTIAQLNLTIGEPPPATTEAAALLIDTTSFFLDLPVDETDIGRISIGQPVEIELDALPDELFTGSVTRLPVAPAPQAPGQNVVTYVIRVTLDATSAPVRAGMTATATIIVDNRADVLIVPNRFVRIDRESGQAFVTVETAPGAYEELPIVLGVRNETETEVVSGAEAGQRVLLLPRAVFDPVAANAGGGPPPE
jgi:HlyD family secretion protein